MLAYIVKLNRMKFFRWLYYMHVKYKLDKQTCQTLRHNGVQLNKSVTIDRSHPALLLLFIGGLTLILMGIATSCGVAEEPLTTPKAPVPVPITVVSAPLTIFATEPAISMAESSPQPTVTAVARLVLVPTPTPLTIESRSTPQVKQTLSLTTTVMLQNRVAISVALIAQSLLSAIQQPAYPIILPTVTASTAMTTPSGTLPPLPPIGRQCIAGRPSHCTKCTRRWWQCFGSTIGSNTATAKH